MSATTKLSGILTTMLALIALYLVLRFGTNASKILGAFTRGLDDIFQTLQGR